MNPAVTLALAVGKKISRKEILLYLSAQFAGAITASGLLKMLFPANLFLGSTHPAGSDQQSFVLEFILTLFLMFTVLSTTKTKNNYAAIAIGAVVLLEALFAGPVCGASMNPFRSLAPALVSGQMQAIWIYLSAPTLGAIAAIYIFNFFEK
jgi:aquaporin Z